MRKKSKNLLPYLGFLLFIPSLLLNIFLLQKQEKAKEGYKVMEVFDGDTILLEGKVKLRLRNLSAPELKFCGGEEAKSLLISLVRSKKITFSERVVDQYGRPMVYVYTDNLFVNSKMIESGWSRYHHDTGSKAEELSKAYEEARKKELGIWSKKCHQTENPVNPKCNIKGNIDKNSDRKNYYYPGCAQYHFTIVEKDIGENWFCTEEEARNAGFAKAQTCQ